MKEEKCKPGGCASLGCEGGHYCFHPDGTPKVMSPEKQAELTKVLQDIFPAKETPVAVSATERREKLTPEQRQAVDDAKAKYLKAIDDAEQKRARSLRHADLTDRYMKIVVMTGGAVVILEPIAHWLLTRLGWLGN